MHSLCCKQNKLFNWISLKICWKYSSSNYQFLVLLNRVFLCWGSVMKIQGWHGRKIYHNKYYFSRHLICMPVRDESYTSRHVTNHIVPTGVISLAAFLLLSVHWRHLLSRNIIACICDNENSRTIIVLYLSGDTRIHNCNGFSLLIAMHFHCVCDSKIWYKQSVFH